MYRIKPIYAEKVMVAIKDCGCIDWYILDRDLCFMDYTKVEEAYRKKGYEILEDNELRFGIKVIDESNKAFFLDKIVQYKVTVSEIKKLLITEKVYNARLAYNPSIMIDFDEKIFISNYPEPASFECFMPTGWVGEYQNFEDRIPLNLRYWIDADGKNIIGG